MNYKELLRNIRFYVLASSLLLAAGIFIWVKKTIPDIGSQAIKLTQFYALIAVTYLYFTMMATPLTRFFTFLPYRGSYLKARRAIGVSAFLFGSLHAYFAFFGELGGFAGLPFLSGKYIFAITLGATSLTILTFLTLTANDRMVKKLTFAKWKILHRFIYLVALLSVIHALMLGSNFSSFAGWIPQVFYIALSLLLVLEAIRFDKYLTKKYRSLPKLGFSLTVILSFLSLTSLFLFFPNSNVGNFSLGIHSAHIQLAKQAQTGNLSSLPSNILGLDGDRTKRYSVRFDHPDKIDPKQQVTLKFRIFDASNGSEVKIFKNVYEKQMHLIMVDDELVLFTHIHPIQTDNGFEINTDFPKAGQYHLYVDFQPLGGIEQQFGFILDVGEFSEPVFSKAQPTQELTRVFGDYQVTLNYPKPLKASSMSIGEQKLTFTIKDAATKKDVTTLKPYLASFGHLVMINQETFDYLHVHPTNIVAPKPDENGGPVVEFLPLGIYGPIKPGIYRVFAQFNPSGNLMVTDYTVKVE